MWGWARRLALTLPVFAATAAFAQTNTSGNEAVKLEKYVVTGSYIPAAVDEASASPVVVVTAKEIDRTGVSKSILDVLRKAVPQIVGGLNIGVENANTASGSTNGGSQVALRNTTTLVLIDGLRAAFSPVAGTGGYQFVDVNVVPVSAVERVEVLTDGASAIYGSDAVSGVVNIILKKNFQGLEIGGSLTVAPTDKGPHYRERVMHLVAGSSAGKTNLTISAEWAKQDPLFERDFNYTSPAFLSSSYAGVVNDNNGNFYRLNPALDKAPTGPGVPTTLAGLAAAGIYVATPGANVPLGFDTSGRPTFSGALDKQIMSLALEHAISDTLTFRSTVLYAKTLNNTNLNPQPIVLRVNSTPGNTGLPGIPFTDVRAQVRNRFLDAGNRDYSNDTSSLRATAEFTGKINDSWTWTADALYNNAKTISIAGRQIVQSALTAGINTGLINLTAIHQDPVKFAQANIFGDAYTIAESRLSSTNLRVNGKLIDLPAGPVYIAAGVDYRKETLAVTADANSIIDPATGTGLWNNGVTVNPFSQGRHIEAGFLEVKLPVTSARQHIPGLYTMDLDVAVRHEKYSDIGQEKPTVPKASLRWLPFNDEFLIRATYAKSFSAPTLYSLFGPASSGATPSLGGIAAYDSSGQPLGVNFAPIQGAQQNGSNPNLLPSHAKSFNVGFVYSPKALRGFSVSADYFRIKESDLVGALGSPTTMVQDVERLGPASIYAPYIHLGDFGQLGGTRVTAPGQLHLNPANVYVDQFNVNTAAQNQSGLDIMLRYDWTNRLGTWEVSSSWNYIRDFVQIPSPGAAPTDFAGTNGFGTLPKIRTYTTFSWTSGAYNASLAGTYDKSVLSSDGVTNIPSYYSFDIQGGIDAGKLLPMLKGLRVTAGINNIFNKFPPVDPNTFSDPPADSGFYGSFGRYYYLDVKYRF